jgi:hypothetical protein
LRGRIESRIGDEGAEPSIVAPQHGKTVKVASYPIDHAWIGLAPIVSEREHCKRVAL